MCLCSLSPWRRQTTAHRGERERVRNRSSSRERRKKTALFMTSSLLKELELVLQSMPSRFYISFLLYAACVWAIQRRRRRNRLLYYIFLCVDSLLSFYSFSMIQEGNANTPTAAPPGLSLQSLLYLLERLSSRQCNDDATRLAINFASLPCQTRPYIVESISLSYIYIVCISIYIKRSSLLVYDASFLGSIRCLLCIVCIFQ